MKSAGRNGSIAAATTAKAANGVAQAKAKLASAQAIISKAKQNSGAYRGSTAASRTAAAVGWGKISRAMSDLLWWNFNTIFPRSGTMTTRSVLRLHRI